VTAALGLTAGAAITDFASWAADIAGRLIRGEIDTAEALAELAKYDAECKSLIAKAHQDNLTTNARIDALIANWPVEPPAVP